MFTLKHPVMNSIPDGYTFGAGTGFIPDPQPGQAATPPAGTPASGTPGQPAPGTSAQGDPNAAGPGNQPGDQQVKTLNPWAPSAIIPPNSGDAPAGGIPPQPAPGTPQPGAAPAGTPAENLATFIKGLELTKGVDLTNIQEELREGKTDALNAAFDNVATNTFRAAMLNANDLIKKQVEKAVEVATRNATDSTVNQFALRSLHQALPFTAKPENAPIAKQVLDGFMNQHKGDVDAAVTATKMYFEQVAKEMAGQFNLTPPPRQDGFGGTPPFGDNTNTPGQQDDAPNWLELLQAPGQ